MSIGTDLLRFSKRKIILFDKESQRVNTMMGNLPFQVSWLVADKNRIYSRHNYYIRWPDFRMSPDAARITRFNQAWVDNGDDPETVLDAFESYVYDEEYLLGGHAILGFDCPLHQLWRRALGRKPDWSYLPRIVDTNLLARAFKMGWKPDSEESLAWQYKVMNKPVAGVKTNLTAMCKELGIPIDETRTHEAMYDLELNYAVYKELIGKVEV